MFTGILRITLSLPENHSLKEKRRVVKSILQQIKNRFEAAASETDHHDLWQTAELGVAVVGNSASVLDSVLNKIIDFVESIGIADLVNAEMEIINMGRHEIRSNR
ncbi:MAG: DUF503 domain-containing protein [Dissulfuribacterales bacterium]